MQNKFSPISQYEAVNNLHRLYNKHIQTYLLTMTNEFHFMYGTVPKLPCNTNGIRINFIGFHQVTPLREGLFYLKNVLHLCIYCSWCSWRSGDNFWELVPPLYLGIKFRLSDVVVSACLSHWGISLAWKCLYLRNSPKPTRGRQELSIL